MARKPRVAVVGGGLGGITAAILLQRAGWDSVTVYEQAPQLARLGAGIHLAPNVMRVMREIGLERQMLAIGLCPAVLRNRAWDTGEDLFTLPVERLCRERYGVPYLIMHRGDLQATLAGGLAPGTLALSRRLVGLDATADGVRLSFADGTEERADFVIGADGVNSRVRQILVGPEPPTYSGLVAYRAIFPAERLGDLDLSESSKWWAEDRHFIVYFLTHRRDEVYFVTGAPDPRWNDGESFVPADMEEIRATFAGFHPEVQRVIAACPQATKWPLLEREPRPLWSGDRVVLLGDACHPMKPHMGQGAGMAIEDAAVLVRCIEATGGDFDAASRMYEATRFERTAKVQRESHKNVWLKQEMDPDWVFGYDALRVPLIAAAAPGGSSADLAAAEPLGRA